MSTEVARSNRFAPVRRDTSLVASPRPAGTAGGVFDRDAALWSDPLPAEVVERLHRAGLGSPWRSSSGDEHPWLLFKGMSGARTVPAKLVRIVGAGEEWKVRRLVDRPASRSGVVPAQVASVPYALPLPSAGPVVASDDGWSDFIPSEVLVLLTRPRVPVRDRAQDAVRTTESSGAYVADDVKLWCVWADSSAAYVEMSRRADGPLPTAGSALEAVLARVPWSVRSWCWDARPAASRTSSAVISGRLRAELE